MPDVVPGSVATWLHLRSLEGGFKRSKQQGFTAVTRVVWFSDELPPRDNDPLPAGARIDL
jgi:hypothetical protein